MISEGFTKLGCKSTSCLQSYMRNYYWMTTKKDDIIEYKEELIKVLEKSQDTFETQLSYISAGALALSIAFIKDIVNFSDATHKWFLIAGWTFLSVTLLANFISHNISATSISKTIDEINNQLYDDNRIKKRFKIIHKINWGTIVTLILGIAFVILYASINIKP